MKIRVLWKQCGMGSRWQEAWAAKGGRSLQQIQEKMRYKLYAFSLLGLCSYFFQSWNLPPPQLLHLLKFYLSSKAKFKCWFLHMPPQSQSLRQLPSVFPWHLVSSSMAFLSALFYHQLFIPLNQTVTALRVRAISLAIKKQYKTHNSSTRLCISQILNKCSLNKNHSK